MFKSRKIHWEQDRTRLNRKELHAPFVEELPDATSNNKHYRSQCVICGSMTNIRCITCGAYLCVKGKFSDGVHEVNCCMKFHTKAKLFEEDSV